MRKKYLFWSIVVLFTIVPIIINFSFKEELQSLSTFIWSLYLIPNILIIVMYPKWKVVFGTALFFSVLKNTTCFLGEDSISKIEMLALILETFVNGAIIFTISYLQLRHNKLLKHIQKLSIIDSLTGLYNRRYFDLYLEKTIPLSQRINSPLTLIVIDIDCFKKVNDHYGHLCGDNALKHISEIIKSNVRNSDAYVRLGGEEFAIILPNTHLEEGRLLAERIREAVEQSDFTYNNEHIHISISMGITLYEGEKTEGFIEKADKALYRAKENGRNQVVVYAL